MKMRELRSAFGVMALSLVPGLASGAGGLFQPGGGVQETASRMLLEPLGGGEVRATVEVFFDGDEGGFAWVVAVPGEVSEVDSVSPSTLRFLHAATAPHIVSPETTGGGGGEPTGNEGDNEVAERAAPVSWEVISEGDGVAVYEWLAERGALLTTEMEPFIDEAALSDMSFVGFEIEAGENITNVAPQRITYNSEVLSVPLLLTALSAQPEMGLIVFVAGDSRYVATNFQNLDIDISQLQADPRVRTSNYFPLLAWLCDEAGGNALFTEYASEGGVLSSQVEGLALPEEDAEEARETVLDILVEYPWMTRLYGRISDFEIGGDIGLAEEGGEEVINLWDLSDRDPLPDDLEELPVVPCGTTYCGLGGQCATTEEGVDGCICGEGFVARASREPMVGAGSLVDGVVCTDSAFDLRASLSESEVEALPDPCEEVDCGEGGECLALNGAATCACDPEFAAIHQGEVFTCAPAVDVFGPEQLLWPGFEGEDDGNNGNGNGNGGYDHDENDGDTTSLGGEGGCSCDTDPKKTSSLTVWMLALWAVGRRRNSHKPDSSANSLR